MVAFLSLMIAHWWWYDWQLIGFANAEVYGHVWNYSWRLEDGFLGTHRTVGTQNFPVIDIIPSVIVGVLASIVSLPIAYNLFLCFCIIGMIYVGARWIQAEQGDALAGVLVLSASPIYWGTLNSGLAEDLGLPIVIAMFWMFRRQRFTGVGLLLGLTAYWGLLQAWMTGVVLALMMFIHRTPFRDIRRVVLMMLVVIVPLVWLHFDRLFLVGHRSLGQLKGYQEPFWMLNPWHHGDVASFLWTQPVDFTTAIIRLHPSYLGWVALWVALHSRSKWWWIFGFCCLASLGPHLYWMGTSTGLPNPLVWLLSWVPGAGLVNHHGRWMMLGLIGFAMLVATGIQHVRYRRLILCCMVLEWWMLSPLGFPLMGTQKIASPVLEAVKRTEMPPETRLLRLPVSGPGVVFQAGLFEQTIHEQRLWLNPNRPIIKDWMKLTPESEWVQQVAHKERLTGSCLPEKVGAVLVKEPFIDRVEAVIGQPTMRDASYAFWSSVPSCVD